MIPRLFRFAHFLFIAIPVAYFTRARTHGYASAWRRVRVNWFDFWTAQGNKIPGINRVECPCCGWTGWDFNALELVYFWKPSVFCPRCDSQERQRMLAVYFNKQDPTIRETTGHALHFAPGAFIKKLLLENPNLHYWSTDFDPEQIAARCPPGTGFVADVQQLSIRDDALDLVFCIHVLEHVRRPSDGIAEIYRALKPRGVAYIMVPFEAGLEASVEWDEPNPIVFDHIWNFSRNDFKNRLEGFEFEEIRPETFLTPAEVRRYRLNDYEVLYRCVKRCNDVRSTGNA